MRTYRKVSKLEEINSLKETVVHNDASLDYITNELYRMENIFKLDETDEIVKENLISLRYIKFSLEYLDKMYRDRLKVLGVRIWLVIFV